MSGKEKIKQNKTHKTDQSMIVLMTAKLKKKKLLKIPVLTTTTKNITT